MIKSGNLVALIILVTALVAMAFSAPTISGLDTAIQTNSRNSAEVAVTYRVSRTQPSEIRGHRGVNRMQLMHSIVPTMPDWMPRPDVGIETVRSNAAVAQLPE